MARRVVIDGVVYAAEENPPSGTKALGIVVSDRGLTFVGRFELTDDPWMLVQDARNVIYWGTTQHLAEIAANGPTDKTRFGLQRDVTLGTANIVAVYWCDESKW